MSDVRRDLIWIERVVDFSKKSEHGNTMNNHHNDRSDSCHDCYWLFTCFFLN